MTLYKIGKVVSIKEKYIILESNYVGEIVYVSNSERFELDKVQKVFIYEYKYEHNNDLYGFKEWKERFLFEDLISLSGIGPKTAMLLLSLGVEEVIGKIVSGDIEGLSKIPNVGAKTIRQIVFELQPKYEKFVQGSKKAITSNSSNIQNLKSALKTLGFQGHQINTAINGIKDFNIPLDQLVEESIYMISNAK